MLRRENGGDESAHHELVTCSGGGMEEVLQVVGRAVEWKEEGDRAAPSSAFRMGWGQVAKTVSRVPAQQTGHTAVWNTELPSGDGWSLSCGPCTL